LQGFIALHRALLDKPIWRKSTPEQKSILITLLLLANHKEEEWEWQGKRFKVMPGQFITSLESIAKAAGVSIQNVRTALVKFKKYEFLTNESTKTGRLITITNWSIYQDKKKRPNKPANKDLTKTQQRPNKDLTTNNNDNNDNNEIMKEEKINYSEHVKMTPTEYQKLVNDHGEETTQKCIQKLDNYIPNKPGKPYADHYRAILSWVINEVKKEAKIPKVRGAPIKAPNSWNSINNVLQKRRGTG
jgi:hypothetical protein